MILACAQSPQTVSLEPLWGSREDVGNVLKVAYGMIHEYRSSANTMGSCPDLEIERRHRAKHGTWLRRL
jgi:hypothetical protein